ncbi:hypothetical protein [Paraburkholderia sp. C35]|uniref:hypothetical protein n=1 Tax=Paraburkholderia sp. C35 TaxID=2126993 RepID=UPI000D69C6B4|nr:hypothetical protein [Paraburkholderia sp. C35]
MEEVRRGYKPLFFPAAIYWDCIHPSRQGKRDTLPSPNNLVHAHTFEHGWKSFATCSVSIVDWNHDYPGPTFKGIAGEELSLIKRITVGVTCTDRAKRPIQATGYLFDKRLNFIGLIEFRYFSERMAKTMDFDVEHFALPMSTTIQVRFQVGGGGSPTVPFPPLISSVFIEVCNQ